MLHAMQISPTTGFFVFLAAVLVIAAASLAYVIAWSVRKVQRRQEPKRSGLAKWTRRDVLGLAGGGMACIAWGGFFEPYRLDVTRTRIDAPKLSGAKRPVRIVHISDLHCDPKVRNERKLPGVIASLSPDLIVYTGDSINSVGGLENFRTCMTEIAEVAPTYVCRGNWDYYFGDTNYFGGTNVVELDGSNRRIDLAGTHLWIAGSGILDAHTEAPASDILDRAMAGIPEEDFKLFLYHYPDLIYSLVDRNVDLHCAGHTHGGQVAMPFYGALVTASKYGKRFEAGLYKVHDTNLYVNRGIGMEGRVPRVRFWRPPEVALIELVPGKPSRTRPATSS